MWHHLCIDDPNDALQLSNALLQESLPLAAAVGIGGFRIWSRLDKHTGGVHFYFSPEASSLAARHGAQSCEPPSREDLGSLLFGDPIP